MIGNTSRYRPKTGTGRIVSDWSPMSRIWAKLYLDSPSFRLAGKEKWERKWSGSAPRNAQPRCFLLVS